MAYIVAAQASQAAAAEEESMTPYTRGDLGENWEFKIIRSATGKFRDPAFQRATLEEEARAGWTFLEKFDNNRIRLKRPQSARKADAGLPIDPYRINFGPGAGAFIALVLAISLGVAAATILGVALLVFAIHGR